MRDKVRVPPLTPVLAHCNARRITRYVFLITLVPGHPRACAWQDLRVFGDYLVKHQARRPPDHLVVEWYAGETPEAKVNDSSASSRTTCPAAALANACDPCLTSRTAPSCTLTGTPCPPPPRLPQAHKGSRANVGFRYNLFDHLGAVSTLRAETSTSYPTCYDELLEPTVFKVRHRRRRPRPCPHRLSTCRRIDGLPCIYSSSSAGGGVQPARVPAGRRLAVPPPGQGERAVRGAGRGPHAHPLAPPQGGQAVKRERERGYTQRDCST